jgi:hypothetical protein
VRTSALRLFSSQQARIPERAFAPNASSVVSGTRRALYVGRIRTSSCQMRPIEAPSSMKAGRAIAVIADWACAVAKQRRHGITRRYYSPQVPSTTPRTCHSDGLELGPYQPGRLLGPASICAGGSMDVLNALGALTV